MAASIWALNCARAVRSWAHCDSDVVDVVTGRVVEVVVGATVVEVDVLVVGATVVDVEVLVVGATVVDVDVLVVGATVVDVEVDVLGEVVVVGVGAVTHCDATPPRKSRPWQAASCWNCVLSEA